MENESWLVYRLIYDILCSFSLLCRLRSKNSGALHVEEHVCRKMVPGAVYVRMGDVHLLREPSDSHWNDGGCQHYICAGRQGAIRVLAACPQRCAHIAVIGTHCLSLPE